MSRPLRIEYPGAYYHIMNRGLAYQDVFTDRSDRQTFLSLLAECHEMWGIRVLVYCFFDNHYHLLIQTPEANLSRACLGSRLAIQITEHGDRFIS